MQKKMLKNTIVYILCILFYLVCPAIMKCFQNDPTDLFGIQYLLVIFVWPIVSIIIGIVAGITSTSVLSYSLCVVVCLLLACVIEQTIVWYVYMIPLVVAMCSYVITVLCKKATASRE